MILFFFKKHTFKWKNNKIYEGGLVFFPFNFLFMNWHGIKNMGVLVSQTYSKLYVIYNVYIVYITI
jgi:hypothetical protein